MADVINFNGSSYNSLDDMPPDVRRMYEQVMGVFNDANQDGVPDMLEGLISPDMAQRIKQQISAIVFNGQTYPNLEQMPPEARAAYEQYQAQYDANRNGVPDAVEGLLSQMGITPTPTVIGQASTGPGQAPPAGWSNSMASQPSASMSASDAGAAPAFAPSAPLMPPARSGLFGGPANTSAISPEGGDNRMRLALIAIAALAIIACGLAVVVVWALLR